MTQNKTSKKEKFSVDVIMDENLIPEELEWHSSQGKDKVKRLLLRLSTCGMPKKMKLLVLIYGQKKCPLKK